MPEQATADVQDLQEQQEEITQPLTEEQKETAEKLGIKQEKDETEEQYGKKVQKRISELTKKFHDKERELETVTAQTRADFEAMVEQNRRLQETVERMTKATESIVENTKPKPPDPFKEIDTEIKSLKTKKAEALENADFKALSYIDDRLDELKERKYEIRLQREKDELAQKIDKKEKESPKDTANVIVEAWIDATEWYNEKSDKYDPIMAGAAIKLEEQLAQDPAWKNKSVKARLDETKRKIEERFGYGKPKQSTMTVDGVNNMSPDGGKPVTLSDDQKYVAHRMFKDLPAKDAEKKYAQYLR